MGGYKVQYYWEERSRTIDKTYTEDEAISYAVLLSKTLGYSTKIVDENDNVVLTIDGDGKSAGLFSLA